MTSQEKWLNHTMSGGLVALLWLLPMMSASASYQVLIEDTYTDSNSNFVQYQKCHTGGPSYAAFGTPDCSGGEPSSGTDPSLSFSQTSTQSSSFVSADLGTGELKLNLLGLSSGFVGFSDVLHLRALA
ncbi:MAG: hypothetical protein KDJ22_06440 [Candidatus Competibacteraceae bacterium]|mgnify:CR=1 FL=1|nr:hypothetical protein [Candidatus Competibacteraceae bacterium]HRX71465.1 hypothetical protein [Candidatus Competibacteraceae bacterium]